MGTGPPSYNLSPKGPKMEDKVCFSLNMGNPIWPFLFCLIVMCFGIQFRAYLIFTSNHYSCASYLQFDIFRIVSYIYIYIYIDRYRFGSLFPYSIFCWGEGVIIGVKESEGRRTVHSWTGNRSIGPIGGDEEGVVVEQRSLYSCLSCVEQYQPKLLQSLHHYYHHWHYWSNPPSKWQTKRV